MELLSVAAYQTVVLRSPTLTIYAMNHQNLPDLLPSSLTLLKVGLVFIDFSMLILFSLPSGSPKINLPNTSYIVTVQQDITITMKVLGFPNPELFLYYLPQNDDNAIFISKSSNPSVSITNGTNDEYNITFKKVIIANEGNYGIVASNGVEPTDIVTIFLSISGEFIREI